MSGFVVIVIVFFSVQQRAREREESVFFFRFGRFARGKPLADSLSLSLFSPKAPVPT